ncbi:MAG TPA: ABC transporter ATP-binding protein [Pseudomonas xinjiangensis]|uniref:ABC transporter ATP-binding protein n=2 Tax=root TaxID=1 RepID=A0A7V1FR44_9GAMM|nr:ABC transporter ATP-binding protein [Halopseudomonas xinjiangensis]HEC47659.1 ABC transporter ATP-binding protein [Halopseudomonas xinjiangensis]
MQLKFEDIKKRFGSLEVIQDFSTEVADGELVALVGPSGCGKSTLLHLAAGLEKPSEGRVLADGKMITAPNPQRTLVFQEHALYPWLTLKANVAMALELQNVSKKQAFAEAEGWLERVSLKGFEHYYPHQVSGGMRQRTALARAFMVKPQILLLDEPFGALDALTRMALQDVLQELIAEHKPSVMLVTHDVDEALYLADRILVFSQRPARVLKEFRFEHCERSHDQSGVAQQRKEILSLLGIKTEVHA